MPGKYFAEEGRGGGQLTQFILDHLLIAKCFHLLQSWIYFSKSNTEITIWDRKKLKYPMQVPW